MHDSCKIVGRYALGREIASGGMATLHLGRLVGSAGFARTVAIKRLHPQFCADPNFVDAFADEARLAARIRHPNVVPTLDVVSTQPDPVSGRRELLLVMEYIDGDSLSALARAHSGLIPLPIVVAIVSEMLHGLHSAHEAVSETGEALGIVHRDVSPQNVLVGADGVARLVDFGIARATGRVGNTEEGEIKGKIAYMAPEQIRREKMTRATDIFAAGIVLWELLTGQRLFASDNVGATLEKILVGWVPPPSSIVRDLPPSFDDIALRALDADPANRFATARDMAVALEDAAHRALGREVAAWVEATAGATLKQRRALVTAGEQAGPTAPLESQLLPPHAPLSHPHPPPPPALVPARPRVTTRSNKMTGPPAPPAHEDTQTLFRGPSEQGHNDAFGEQSTLLARPLYAPPVETDRTMTVFSAGEESYGEASYDGSRGHLAGEVVTVPPPPARRLAAAKATVVFVLAAAITVLVGARYVNVRAASASASAASAAKSGLTVAPMRPVNIGSTAEVPVEHAASNAPPLVVAPAVSSVAALPRPTTAIAAPPPPPPTTAPPSSPPPAYRRAVKPRSAPVRTPCVARLDPVTGKTVYKGDCD